jgi:hypothetical protein
LPPRFIKYNSTQFVSVAPQPIAYFINCELQDLRLQGIYPQEFRGRLLLHDSTITQQQKSNRQVTRAGRAPQGLFSRTRPCLQQLISRRQEHPVILLVYQKRGGFGHGGHTFDNGNRFMRLAIKAKLFGPVIESKINDMIPDDLKLFLDKFLYTPARASFYSPQISE